MPTIPEITTSDVQTFAAGQAEAVLQRHALAAGDVQYDVYASLGFDIGSCGDPARLFDAASVLMQSGNALRFAQRRQAMDAAKLRHPAGSAL